MQLVDSTDSFEQTNSIDLIQPTYHGILGTVH